ALKAIGARTRLVRAGAHQWNAVLLQETGDHHDHRLILHRARPGDDWKLSGTEHRAADAHGTRLRPKLAPDQLVRLSDANALGDAGQHFDLSRVHWPRIARDADRRSVRPGHR